MAIGDKVNYVGTNVFTIGDRVRINDDEERLRKLFPDDRGSRAVFLEQSGDGCGTVVAFDGISGWRRVKWDNGHTNIYPSGYLVPASAPFKPSQDMSDKALEYEETMRGEELINGNI